MLSFIACKLFVFVPHCGRTCHSHLFNLTINPSYSLKQSHTVIIIVLLRPIVLKTKLCANMESHKNVWWCVFALSRAGEVSRTEAKALTCMGKPGMGSREDDWLMTSGPLSTRVWFGSWRERRWWLTSDQCRSESWSCSTVKAPGRSFIVKQLHHTSSKSLWCAAGGFWGFQTGSLKVIAGI